ncbi:MAG: phosphatidylcholine/phosphatidylserine synthase [Alphaproteobacteria bacterium]|nr:phosphatidylcholine/phosphatidylserine synthase [Alphaproteobacteria bacterium]
MRGLSLNRLVPNILTLLALCAGLSAIRFGLDGRFPAAVGAVLLAAVLDGLDGRVARLMNATSRFGAELDSLSDFVCFGVVPPLLLYLWLQGHGAGAAWPAVMIFAVCTALRLARFNVALDDHDRPAWTYHFFSGVPSPAGAGLALLPMVASFELPWSWLQHPWVIGVWLVMVALLMVSRLPTFSGKRVRVRGQQVVFVLLAVGALAAGVASEPWLTLLGCGLIYLGLIPVAVVQARRMQRASPPPPAPASPSAEPSGPAGDSASPA